MTMSDYRILFAIMSLVFLLADILFRELMYGFSRSDDWWERGDKYAGCIYDRAIDLDHSDELDLFYDSAEVE